MYWSTADVVVVISVAQAGQSVINIFTLFLDFFTYRSLQNIE